jgi:hypothetical protein
MNSERAHTEDSAAHGYANPAIVADLQLQLQASQERERAARAEARRLAREMILARRLLKLSFEKTALTFDREGAAPRLPAALLEKPVYYDIDSCRDEGTHMTISGWAFRPDPAWDSRETTVTVLFHGGATTYYAASVRVLRWDVAAYYAAEGFAAFGGARGLEGAGFACKVLRESLPAAVDLRIALRLECGGMACEQFTESRLRL